MPILLGALVGIVAGVASAGFLVALDAATHARTTHPTLVLGLPLAGLLIGLVYERIGASVARGTHLVVDAARHDGARIPARMAPLVLVGTVLTHLFGGSAGREGTAVQMGASLADTLAARMPGAGTLRASLVHAGIAAGFGSVFGTPFAGVVFAYELGARPPARQMLPAVIASFVGDLATRGLGVVHTPYPRVARLGLTPLLLAKWVAFALAVAAVAVAFVSLTKAIKALGERYLVRLPLRMLVGGAVVVALSFAAGTTDYLGLGVPTILASFEDHALPTYAFGWKVVFTAITVGSGFLGGEVTPLFFIGATLGHALAGALGLPIDVCAGVGLVAVYAACVRAPIALTVMGAEILGVAIVPHAAFVAAIATLLVGRRGLYDAPDAAERVRGQSASGGTSITG